MRVAISAAVLVGAVVAGSVLGQVSPEEARQRLAQKQAERAAASTRPATLTKGQVDQLLAQIESLKAQVTQLRSDNDALRKQLAAKGPASKPVAGAAPAVAGMPPGVKPKSTFTRRSQWVAANFGQQLAGRKNNPNEGAPIDAAIGRYLAAHPLSDEMAAAMYEGRPAIGIPEDALKVFGIYSVRAESTRGKTAALIVTDFLVHGPDDTPIYELTIVDGKVDSFANPTASTARPPEDPPALQ